MDDIPFGFRFRPTEEELILHYLCPKVNGEHVPGEGRIVFDIDLYADEPSKIWENFKTRRENMQGDELYLFTKLKTRGSKDSRICRTTMGGKGSWKGEDGGKPVKASGTDQRVIGMRRRFTYMKKGSSDNDGGWLMQEFDLDKSLVRNVQAEKFVLCLLKKNDKKRKEREYDDDLGGTISAPVLGTQEKRQCLLSQPSEEVDEFAAEIEQALEVCVEDDSALTSSHASATGDNASECDEFAAELEQLLEPFDDGSSLVLAAHNNGPSTHAWECEDIPDDLWQFPQPNAGNQVNNAAESWDPFQGAGTFLPMC